MSIDTSSYYPEVPTPDGRDNAYSLNNRKGGLFGDRHNPDSDPQPESKPEKTPDNSSHTHSSKDKDDDKSLGEKITDGVSNLLSWVLVPLLMPVYGLMLAFGLSILDVAPMGMRIAFTLIVAGICVFVPMVLILLLKKIGMIEDVGLNGRQERLVPYIITIVCFGVTAWFMATKGAPLWLSLFFAGGALATVICTVVNFWWKISAHAAGIAGVVALLIRIEKDGSAEPELFFWLILTLLLTGLLGSARVWLGRHTVWQVLAGYAVGFCSVFFLTMIR
ncbi:MAG: hypothetical protein K2L34_08200 [Muribaculaceae bacterium]|nr:hypothetical protein [Muribaculaceae bacterium]